MHLVLRLYSSLFSWTYFNFQIKKKNDKNNNNKHFFIGYITMCVSCGMQLQLMFFYYVILVNAEIRNKQENLFDQYMDLNIKTLEFLAGFMQLRCNNNADNVIH